MDILGTILFSSVVVVILLILQWNRNRYKYWERRGVISPPTHFLFGNILESAMQKINFGILFRNYYQYYRAQKVVHGGTYFFNIPMYVPVDLEIIKNILQKDFHHFVDRGVYYNAEDDPLSANLFSVEGNKWKNLRAKLTPTFTSGKMRMMFPLLENCAANLLTALSLHNNGPLEIRDILARFTTDVIGCCAFGIDCNSFDKGNNEFRFYGKRIFEPTFLENMRSILGFINPDLMRYLKCPQNPVDAANFFLNLLRETIKYRENHDVGRKDFLYLLLQLKNEGYIDKDANISETVQKTTLTVDEMAAQAFIFFIAGFETSSTTMAFCLYELAKHPDMQDKVREEINSVLRGGKLNYEVLKDMTYLDKVIKETLRKYPPLPVLIRHCNEEYNVPGTGVTIDKGTKVLIPIYGIHHDEELYPNPQEFDPERFSLENKNSRNMFSYMPFGEGPRNCIGLRFGMMQTQVGICHILMNYKVTVDHKTKEPLEFEPRSFILSAKGGLWLNCHGISG